MKPIYTTLIEFAKQGKTIEEIIALTGFKSAGNVLRKYNIPVKRKESSLNSGYQKQITTEIRAQIIELAKQGYTNTDIRTALKITVSRQRIHQILNKAGLNIIAIRQQEQEKLFKENFLLKTGIEYSKKEFINTDLYKCFKTKLNKKRYSAKANNVEFNITLEDIVFPQFCPITGIELDYMSEGIKNADNTPSFDRIDSSKGYVKGNVAILSSRANRIKNDGTLEEHKRIVQYMEQHTC